MIKSYLLPKSSRLYKAGYVNMAIVGEPMAIESATQKLSSKYPDFQRLTVGDDGRLTVTFWLQRGLCSAFRNDWTDIKTELVNTAQVAKKKPPVLIHKVSSEEVTAARALIASPSTDRSQFNELWEICEKVNAAIAAAYRSNCFSDYDHQLKEKRLKRLRTMLRAKVRKVTTSHVDASEVLTIFEDTQGKKLRKIAIPAVEYTTPDGRSVTRDECLAAATAHWGEILEASRYCRQVQSVCPDYAHFMISRYSCLEAYLSAQGVGDTSRMRLVVIERAIAMLEDIKTHYGSKETLAEKLAYVLRLEGRFADWMIDVKAMFFSRVIAVATVSHQLDLHHIHEAIRQLEKMRHAALFAKHLAESVLRPPEFFLLRSYPEDLTY